MRSTIGDVANAGPPVDLRPMGREPGEVALFEHCFAKNGSPRSGDIMQWQYLQNPTGKLFVDFAVPADAGERVAAIYAALPMWMRVNGERVLGLQSVDTMTDAGFRGRGLFV